MPSPLSPQLIPPDVRSLCQKLVGAGYQAYVVGGAVRDLVNRATHAAQAATTAGAASDGGLAKDFDLTTSAHPEQVTALVGARHTIPTGIAHGTVTVLCDRPGGRPRPVEVTTFRGEVGHSDGRRPDKVEFIADLYEDLRRRDFTINSMAYDPLTDTLHDPFDGRGDLERRLVRAVGAPEQRFSEDGLRVLRAVRFAAQLGFALDGATRAAFAGALPTLRRVSRERVRDELLKLLAAAEPSHGLLQMIEAADGDAWDPERSVLTVVLPELARALPAERGRVAAFLCSLDEVATADRLSAFLYPLRSGERGRAVLSTLGSARELGALLDERLKLPSRERDFYAHFLLLDAAPLLESAGEPKALRRLLAAHGEALLLTLLSVGEHAAQREADGRAADFLRTRQALAAVIAERPPLTAAELALTGKELMKELAIAPGPQVGVLLRGLLEAVLDEPARNQRDTLLGIARQLLAASG